MSPQFQRLVFTNRSIPSSKITLTKTLNVCKYKSYCPSKIFTRVQSSYACSLTKNTQLPILQKFLHIKLLNPYNCLSTTNNGVTKDRCIGFGLTYTINTSLAADLKPSSNIQRRRLHHSACTDKEMSALPGSSSAKVNAEDTEATLAARSIFQYAVKSVLPHQMIEKNLHYDATASLLRVGQREYHLQRNVFVVGFGKAVLGMGRALESCIGSHIVRGILSVPLGSQQAMEKAGMREMLLQPDSPITVMEGAADNLPDADAAGAAREITKIIKDVGEEDILIVLISGGGSALLPAPIPPLTLDDTLTLTRVLSRAGVNILDLNMVRKQTDLLKGGGIAALASPAQVIALVLSDIIGDDLSFIASGPTVPDISTPQACLQLISKVNVESSVPPKVLSFLRSQEEMFKSKGHQTQTDVSHVQNVLIGTNRIACEAACSKALGLKYLPYMLSTELSGEARSTGVMFALLAKYMVDVASSITGLCSNQENDAETSTNGIEIIQDRLISEFGVSQHSLNEIGELVEQAVTPGCPDRGVCVVAGGETTVMVKGKGRGGRNQEMAVTAGLEIHKMFQAVNTTIDCSRPQSTSDSNCVADISVGSVVFLSAGTDGQDGPTSAAGAVTDVNFVSQARQAGLDIDSYMENNDSFTLLSTLNSGSNLVLTGLTGTNVMDIQVLLVTFN